MVAERSTHLYTDEAYVARLRRSVEEAAEERRAYAVIACVPNALPGEVTSDVFDAVANCVLGMVRDDDLPGLLDSDAVIVGLPGTDATGAQVLAHRLQSELTLRSTPFRNTVWDAAFACLPGQGLTADELLSSAIELARTRRTRLASEPY